ncbi:uncharacterized protein LOC120174675 [Hibiscus syriacus]|uniref:uncharacterized protein LOC120174675 n=1 Tax=Hibiscus syriacus TaxID=106335 RepID=UPI0019250114|nr:uncharacterized protein LOC120174675 [Hibiscus syriacus]
MVKLLLNCKADRQAKNQDGSTALEVAERHNSRESITVLRGFFIPLVSNFSQHVDKQIIKYITKASSLIFHDMENISEQDRNALLVILGLLLTATYQTSFSPPGGVWQADCSSSSAGSTLIEKRESPGSIGTAVMDKSYFLLFYSLTYVVFIATFFLTLALLRPFPRGIRTALQLLLAFLALCFDQSISIIAPTFSTAIILNIFSTIMFVFMVFMCISYKVSKLAGGIVAGVIQGFLLFLILYDEFWKGTLLVVGYSLFFSVGYSSGYGWNYPTAFIAFWLLLNRNPKSEPVTDLFHNTSPESAQLAFDQQDQPQVVSNFHPMHTRSKSEIRKPKSYHIEISPLLPHRRNPLLHPLCPEFKSHKPLEKH